MSFFEDGFNLLEVQGTGNEGYKPEKRGIAVQADGFIGLKPAGARTIVRDAFFIGTDFLPSLALSSGSPLPLAGRFTTVTLASLVLLLGRDQGPAS